MKKLLILIPIIVLAFALMGCSLIEPFIPDPDPVEELSADVVVVDWEQECPLGVCGDVEIYYKISNVGTVTIDYYQIWFKVICDDGNTYSTLEDGFGIAVDEYDFNHLLMDVDSGEAIRVEVVNWELTHWKF